MSAENGVGASAASLLLSVDVAQRFGQVDDFEALNWVSLDLFELTRSSVVEGLGGPGLVGKQLFCRVMSKSEWASAMAHAFFEKASDTRTFVSNRTWSRTNRPRTVDPSSKDSAAYSFHRKWRPTSSSWQVFKVPKKQSSSLSDQQLFPIWVINRFEPWFDSLSLSSGNLIFS